MIMADEDELRTLLQEAAAIIELPETGADSILAAASATVRPDGVNRSIGSIRSISPRSAWGRTALVAAVIFLVIGGIALVGVGASHRGSSAGPSIVTPSIGHPSASGSSPPLHQQNGPALGAGGTAGQAPSPASSAPPNLPPGSVGQSAKVETTGSVDLTIGNGLLSEVVNKLTGLTTGQGGFVAKSQLQEGSAATGISSYGSLVLQVPQPSFSSLLSGVEEVGKVTSVSSTSTDVTGQYVDLQARISALEASRQQYLTIMSKAESIGDILSVQSQLDTIQSEIEQLQGQLDLLNSETTYATLTVSLSPAGQPPPPPPHPASGISSAWHDSIGGFTGGVEWLVRIAGPTLFALILLAALGLAVRWGWRAWRRRLL
jgi:hypothetical protein